MDTLAAATRRDNLQGAGLMALGMAGFASSDAFMKLAMQEMPLFQTLFLRGVATTTLMAVLGWMLGTLRLRVARRDRWLLGWRTVLEAVTAFFFLTALANMPLANATSIMQALPLVLTLAAALVLREPVGWRRWGAILVGFCGVMMIVQPGAEGFNVYALYALCAVATVTIRDLVTRQMARALPSLTVATLGSAGVTALAGLIAVASPWVPVAPLTILWMAGSAGAVVVAYTSSVAAMRTGDIAMVTPFRFAGLLWALILGFVVFGDWPDALTLAGAAVVVATGLYTLHRERRVARHS